MQSRDMNRAIRRVAKRSQAIKKAMKFSSSKKRALYASAILVSYSVLGARFPVKDGRSDRTVKRRHPFDFIKHVNDIGEELFQRLYRVSIAQFHILVSLLTPKLKRKQLRRNCPASTLTVELMLCITLRILAGASYLDVGWPYGVGRNTPFYIFQETLDALNDILPRIAFPESEEECIQRSEQYQRMRRSPIKGIVAALDGIAIAIQQPKLTDAPDPRKYYNRKGFYAICVQAAVSANYKFLFVSARHSGATHDSTAFQSSSLNTLVESGRLPDWACIAADDAYACGSHILTPYSGNNLSQEKDTFNFYLSSCRITVEQVFGMLVNRFGIFWSPLKHLLSKSTLIIMVACKLHNFIIDNSPNGMHNILGIAEENNVIGTPVVHLQNFLHTEQDAQRTRQRGRENSTVRDRVARRLTELGYARPRTRRC